MSLLERLLPKQPVKDNLVHGLRYKLAVGAFSLGLLTASVGLASAAQGHDQPTFDVPNSLDWGNPDSGRNPERETSGFDEPSLAPKDNDNYVPPIETPVANVGISPIIKSPDIAPKTEIKPNLPGYSLQFPNFPEVTGHFFPEKAGFVKGFAVLNDKVSQMWTEYNKTGGYEKWGEAVSTSWRGPDGKIRQAFKKGILEVEVDSNGRTIKAGPMNIALEVARKKLDLKKSRPNPDIYGPKADKLSILSLLPKMPAPKTPDISGLSENVKQALDINIVPEVAKPAVSTSAIQAQESLAQNPENMAQYWPLQVGNYWEFEGITKEGVVFHTRIEVEKELEFCGTKVYSLLFTKDKIEGYWAPGENLNLRWYIAKDFQWFGSKRYRFAKGDERFVRDSNDLGKDPNIKVRTTLYHRDDPSAPAYMLFPEVVDGTPFSATQNYYASCDTNTTPWTSEWGVTYNKTDNTTMLITYSEIDHTLPIPNPWAIEPYTLKAALGPFNIEGKAPSDRIFNMRLIKAFVQNPMLDGLLKSETAGRYIYGNQDFKKISPDNLSLTEIPKESAMAYNNNGLNSSGNFAPYDKMVKRKADKEQMLALYGGVQNPAGNLAHSKKQLDLKKIA